MGEGEGGGDYGSELQDFLFLSPSPRPSPAGGEGVSVWKVDSLIALKCSILTFGMDINRPI